MNKKPRRDIIGLFGKKHGQQNSSGDEEKIESLYKSIGELKVENDWLKKKLQLLG